MVDYIAVTSATSCYTSASAPIKISKCRGEHLDFMTNCIVSDLGLWEVQGMKGPALLCKREQRSFHCFRASVNQLAISERL